MNVVDMRCIMFNYRGYGALNSYVEALIVTVKSSRIINLIKY